MIVVGVGCGPGMLTEEAMDRICKARKIFGSSRAVEMVRRHIPVDAEVALITDYSGLSELPDDSLVLSTGDPMLAGLGHLGMEVIPGISSMQLAFSRLRLPLAKAVVVDAHGKDPVKAILDALEELERGRIPFLLTDPAFDISVLASSMASRDLKAKIVLCERLGYPDEVISFGNPLYPPKGDSDLMAIVLHQERGR